MSEETNPPVVGRQTPNQNEQRALGGFFVESEYNENEFELIQVEVPVGCQRTAHAFDDDIQTDMTLDEILSARNHSDTPAGFPDEKELSDRFGFRMSSYTAKIDAVIVMSNEIYITEVKTRNQRITGLHEVYEGFGQVLMNRDRFIEDYPSVAKERDLIGLLLAEDSSVDIDLILDSFRERNMRFFDPRRGGFLT